MAEPGHVMKKVAEIEGDVKPKEEAANTQQQSNAEPMHVDDDADADAEFHDCNESPMDIGQEDLSNTAATAAEDSESPVGSQESEMENSASHIAADHSDTGNCGQSTGIDGANPVVSSAPTRCDGGGNHGESGPYITLTAAEEETSSRWKQFIGLFTSSKKLKDVLENYTLELFASDEYDSMTLTWEATAGTMIHFKLMNLSREKDLRKTNKPNGPVQFNNLELGVQYQLDVTSSKGNDKKEASLKFKTRPKAVRHISVEGNQLTWEKAVGAESLSVAIATSRGKEFKKNLQGKEQTVKIDELQTGEEIDVEINALAKDPRSFNKCFQTLRVGGNVVPFDVKAVRSEENPYRNVKVSWHPPEDCKDVKTYVVKIIHATFKEFSKPDIETHNTSCCFEKLMSNARYFCTVQVKNAMGCLGETSKSNIVETKSKKRQSVNISDVGKPSNFEKNITYGATVRCQMSWNRAQLGTHAEDYELEDFEVTISEISSQTTCRKLDRREFTCSEGSAEATLKWGMEYAVRLEAKYRDLDTLEENKAIEKQKFSVACKEVAEIKIEESADGKTTISWPVAEGAVKYFLQVYHANEQVYSSETFLKQTSLTIETGPALTNGKEYEFVVASYNVANDKKMKKRKHFLGLCAPRDLNLAKSRDDSHRSVCLSWSVPRQGVPKEYECRLYGTEGELVKKVAPSQTSVSFTSLKQGSEYYASVRAVYETGSGVPAYSKDIRTNEGEKMQRGVDYFIPKSRVKNLEVTVKSASIDESEVSIKWEKPEPPKEFLRHFCVLEVWLQITDQLTKKTLLSEQQPEQSERTTKLPRGRSFLIEVAVIYKNIDLNNVVRATQEKKLETDIHKPDIKAPTFHDKKMRLSWTCPSCTTFKWEILDGDGLEVLDSGKVKRVYLDLPIGKNYRLGTIRQFKVTGVAPNGMEETTLVEQMIIGGKDVPLNVVCLKSQKNPRRLLDVRWEEPKGRAPQKYIVKLYEENFLEHVDEQEVESLEAQFTGLKAGTRYFAKVTSMGAEGPNGTSESDVISTNAALEATRVKDLEFPSQIRHDVPNRSSSVTILWMANKFEEVYSILHYEICVSECHWLRKAKLPSQRVETADEGVELTAKFEDLKQNVRYVATVTANIRNIDTGEEGKVLGTHKFRLSFTQPIMKPVKENGKKITMMWERIEDAIFDIEITDAGTTELLRSWHDIENDEISFDLDDEKLRIGRECRIRLLVRSKQDDGAKPQEKCTSWTFGGKKVPVNVVASPNPDKPHRYINLKFSAPKGKDKPECYEILARPKTGPTKMITTNGTLVTFRRLRSETLYQFEVVAVFKDDSKSSGSLSQRIRTEPSPHQTHPSGVNVRNPGQMHWQDVKVVANIHMQQEPGYDSVQDPKVIPCDMAADFLSESIKVSWHAPLFGGNQDNFVVNSYRVEIFAIDGKSVIEKNFHAKEQLHETSEVSLELGKKYSVTILCRYENIDQMTDSESRWTDVYQASPCKPEITKNTYDEELQQIQLSWLCEDGAECFKVEITCDGKTAMLEKTQTPYWSGKFNEKCNYGNTYVAKITAQNQGKENCCQSKPTIIGGEMVPRQAVATRGVGNSATTANLTWKEPEKAADYYLIEKIEVFGSKPFGSKRNLTRAFEHIREIGERSDKPEKQLSGLNPGTEYKFKIYAVHGDKFSGGCSTNHITTDNGPGKVEILKAECDEGDGSTKVYVRWKKEDECSEYKISLLREGKLSTLIEEWTTSTSHTVGGLIPGATYSITITGRSCTGGFGNPSDAKRVTTRHGRPKMVSLALTEERAQVEATLQFGEAQGSPRRYRIITQDEKGKECEPIFVDTNEATIANLSPNTLYRAAVQAEYEDEDGEGVFGDEVFSNFVRTAPNKPRIVEVSQYRHDSSRTVSLHIEWQQNPESKCHQVCVSRGHNEEIIAEVKNATTWEYHPVIQEGEVAVKVRSQNDSGFFGEWSDEIPKTLVPRPPEDVKAQVLENGHLKVTWDQTQHEAKHFKVIPYCNESPEEESGELTTQEFIKRDPVPASDYRFVVITVGSMREPSFESQSNIVHSRPEKCASPKVELEAQQIFTISWCKVEKCSYEIKISKYITTEASGTEAIEEAILSLKHEQTKCKYACQELGTLYGIAIRAKYQTTFSEWSNPAELSTAPKKIMDLKIKAEENTLKVSWKQQQPLPQEYNLQFFQSDLMTGVSEKFGGVQKQKCLRKPEMTIEKKNVPFGKAYRCEIVAVTGGVKSATSQSDLVFVMWEKPTFFLVRPDEIDPSHSAHLKWGERERAYDVWRYKLVISNGQEKLLDIQLSDTAYRFTGGNPGVTYDVELYWGADDKLCANPFRKSVTLAPDKVVNVKTNQDDKGNLILSWAEVRPRPNYYIVSWEEDGKEFEKEVQTGETRLAISPNPGNVVFAKVAACNESGKGEFSDICEGFLAPPKPLAIEVAVPREKGDTAVLLSVQDFNDSKTIRKKYIFSATEGDSAPITSEVDTSACLLSGLQPGSAYFVSVESEIRGKRSEKVSYPELVRTRPSKMKNLLHTSDSSSLVFEWDRPKYTVRSYLVELKKDDEKAKEYFSDKNSFTIYDPTPGTFYSIRVAAENSAGLGERSNWYEIITAPKSPDSVSATYQDRSVIFHWKCSDKRITKYVIEYKLEGDSDAITLNCFTLGYQLLDPKSSRVYLFRVKSQYKNRDSEWSSWMTFRCPPGRVTSISKKKSTRSISMTWENPSPSIPNSYLVEWEDGPIFETANTEFQRSNLEPCRSYRFRIGGRNETGLGEMSEWQSVSTEPVPPRIKSVEGRRDGDMRTFVVSLEDETIAGKLYIVKAVDADGNAVEERSKKKRVEIRGLRSATKYTVFAQTEFEDMLSEPGKYTGN